MWWDFLQSDTELQHHLEDSCIDITGTQWKMLGWYLLLENEEIARTLAEYNFMTE